MTQAIACNSNYDMFLGTDGHIAMVSGLDAVEQNCRSALSVRLGECVLDLTRGMPFFEAAFNNFNPAQYEAAGRMFLLTLAGVTAVKSFVVTRDGSTFKYRAEISTVYGDGVVNG